MTPESTILAAMLVPLVGAAGIAFAGRMSDNLREAVTLVTAALLAWLVWGLLPDIMDGGRPELTLASFGSGLDIAFRVEPLGMLFAALALSLIHI